MDPSPPHPKAIGDADMDQFEANTHPFVVKVWLEETAEEAGRAAWRGHITYVPTGERRYFHDLGDIEAFIAPYLERMGVQVRRRSGVARFLERVSVRHPGEDKMTETIALKFTPTKHDYAKGSR